MRLLVIQVRDTSHRQLSVGVWASLLTCVENREALHVLHELCIFKHGLRTKYRWEANRTVRWRRVIDVSIVRARRTFPANKNTLLCREITAVLCICAARTLLVDAPILRASNVWR